MSGALKVVGVVLGAVAVVATAGAALGVAMGGTMMLSGVASAATIASIAGGAAAVVSSISQAIAKPPNARGSVSQIVIAADAPQPYVMGEGYTAGVLRHRTAYGGKVDKVHNPYLFDAIVYSGGGPVQSIAPRVDGAAVGAYYSGWLYTTSQLGLCPQPTALSPQWPGATGWGASHKLSGQAAIGWSFQFDKEGKVFASGLPQTGAYGQWVKVYDPRLDSTQPGGSGSHRLGNESTYGYSDNPALHAATYAYGRYQNGKRVIGMGLPADAIDWQVVAAWANTCQLNNWRLFGVVYEPADRWANLVDICAAGGAEPIPGAILSFRYQAPRVALDTITESDIAEEDCTVCAMQSYRDRVNIVIPKRLFPNANWELMSDVEVAVAAYIDDDGEERPREWPFNFVKDSKQARELAAYKLVDTRELFPIELTCIPRLRGYRPGDCLHLSLPQLGLDHDAIILHREFDPATLKVKLTLISETAGKHAFALGQSSAAPPTASLSPNGAERDETAWRPPAWADIIDDDPLHPKPEDGATVGAPSGTDIGGVPVDQWLLDMEQLQTDMETAEGIVTDLLDAYGSTTSAGASAAAALNAKLAAEQARDDAQDAFDAAAAAASTAGASASTAGSHASTATTKAGEASTSAGNAAASADTAEGHKNAAAVSAGVAASANTAVDKTMIADPPMVLGETWCTFRSNNGSPDTVQSLAAGSVVGGVYTWEATNTYRSITFKRTFPWVQGRVYRVEAEVEATNLGSGGDNYAILHAGRMNADYTLLGELYNTYSRKATPLGARVKLSTQFGCGITSDANIGLWNVPECPHFRMSVLCGRLLTNVGSTGSEFKVYSFTVRDGTDEYTANQLLRENKLSQAKRAQYFMDGADGWASNYGTAAAKTPTTVPTFATNYEGAARVLKGANGRWDLSSFETYPILPGRKYRVRHRLFIGGSPASTQTYTGFALLDAAGAFDSYRYTHSTVLGAGWNERDVVVNCDDILAARPLAAQLRLLAFHNYGAAVGTETAVAYFTIDDVTDSEAAKASATAASNSASSASASASTAGSHASTASTHAGTAATKAGEASSYAGSAASSAATAEGHKNSASSSAILAASAKEGAETAATAASNSASSASASASTAGSHASTASSQAGIAATKAGEASTFSSSAASSAATAEGHANAASMSAGVAASMGQGALNKNAGFDSYPSATVGDLPTGWALSGTSDLYRVADPQGGYAVRIPSSGTANAGIQQDLTAEQLLTQNGYYVIEVDVVLRAGGFVGAGVLFNPRNQSDASLSNLWLDLNTDPDITSTVQSAPTVGRAYSFRKLVQATGADPRGFMLYAFTKHTGLAGSNTTANDIEWRKVLVRPATQAEINGQTALGPLEATVSSHTSAIATVNSTLATQSSTLTSQGITLGEHAFALTTLEDDLEVVAARWGVQIDANGRIIGRVKLDGSESSSLFEVMASVFRVVNPGGGAGLTWADGVLWNKGSSRSVILGQNFGTSGNLLFWAGPNPSSPSAANKSNGVFWIDNAGNAYFGGSLSAGVLKNSAQTTLLTHDAEVIVGPFTTNGAAKSIIASYAYSYSYTGGGTTTTFSQPMTAQIEIHRSVNGGAWTLVQTLNCTGTYTHIGATGSGFAQQFYNLNGSVTFNDSTAATGNLRFRAKLVDFKINGTTQAFARPNGSSQNIALTSIEE